QEPRHLPMGARSGGRAEAARREPSGDARAPRDGRASVRHAEDAHGHGTLSDEAPAEGRQRDGTARARLQSDARDEHHGRQAADRGDECVRHERARARAADLIKSLTVLRETRGSHLGTVIGKICYARAKSALAGSFTAVSPRSETFLRDQDPEQTWVTTAHC